MDLTYKFFVTGDLTLFSPEIWAQEALYLLSGDLVMAQLVHRDYSTEVAAEGDVVNIQMPASLTASRKQRGGSVNVQEPTASRIQVKLDQHIESSFIIEDVDAAKSQQELFSIYLQPAVQSIAEKIDRMLSGQYVHSLDYQSGNANGMTDLNVRSSLIGTRKRLNQNFAPLEGRNLIWTPESEAHALSVDAFVSAEKVGDDGTALRTASVGNVLGFNHWMTQYAPSVSDAVDEVVGAVNGTMTAGSTTLTVDGFTAAIANGSFIRVDGAGVYRVVSSVGGATPTSLTLSSALHQAPADNAVVTVSDPGAVNFAAGYAAGYSGDIAYDGTTKTPVVGQAVAFGTSATSDIYSIIEVTSTTITLDRPLEAAISDNDAINLGPNGEYNFAFTEGAIALVTRALPQPKGNTSFATVNYKGLGIRVLINYDDDRLADKVTVDLLCGVKTIRPELGTILLG